MIKNAVLFCLCFAFLFVNMQNKPMKSRNLKSKNKASCIYIALFAVKSILRRLIHFIEFRKEKSN